MYEINRMWQHSSVEKKHKGGKTPVYNIFNMFIGNKAYFIK